MGLGEIVIGIVIGILLFYAFSNNSNPSSGSSTLQSLSNNLPIQNVPNLFTILHTNNFIGCWATVAYGDQLKFQINSDNTFYLMGPGGLITGSWSDLNSTTIDVTYSGQTGQTVNDIVNYDTTSKSISMVNLKLFNDAPVKFIKGTC
ncbi:MAG: hypothetical protein WC408_04515 [Candidatus Micrarchaeia archaeon]|jgi:hypothetical protein